MCIYPHTELGERAWDNRVLVIVYEVWGDVSGFETKTSGWWRMSDLSREQTLAHLRTVRGFLTSRPFISLCKLSKFNSESLGMLPRISTVWQHNNSSLKDVCVFTPRANERALGGGDLQMRVHFKDLPLGKILGGVNAIVITSS